MGTILALTLFGSFWGALTGIILFLIICFLSDIYKNGFIAFVFLIVFCTLYYFWGTNFEPFLSYFTWTFSLIYFGSGLVFSIFRTFFEGRKLGRELKDVEDGYHYIEDEERKIIEIDREKKEKKDEFIDDLKGNVFRWWFLWPISLINWLFTDLIKELWDYLYSKLKNVYNYVLDLGIKSIN